MLWETVSLFLALAILDWLLPHTLLHLRAWWWAAIRVEIHYSTWTSKLRMLEQTLYCICFLFLCFVYTPSQQITCKMYCQGPWFNYYTAFCYVTIKIGVLSLSPIVFYTLTAAVPQTVKGSGERGNLPIQCDKERKYFYNIAWVTCASMVRIKHID